MGLSEASADGDSDKEKAKKLETNDEEGPVEDEDENENRFRRWLSKRKDRLLASQEALRPGSSITGQYGNSMQYGSTF